MQDIVKQLRELEGEAESAKLGG
jgi:hypothetical protein